MDGPEESGDEIGRHVAAVRELADRRLARAAADPSAPSDGVGVFVLGRCFLDRRGRGHPPARFGRQVVIVVRLAQPAENVVFCDAMRCAIPGATRRTRTMIIGRIWRRGTLPAGRCLRRRGGNGSRRTVGPAGRCGAHPEDGFALGAARTVTHQGLRHVVRAVTGGTTNFDLFLSGHVATSGDLSPPQSMPVRVPMPLA